MQTRFDETLHDVRRSGGLRLFAFALLCAIVVYAMPLTHFTLNIDGESQNNFAHTVSLGRWAHAILRLFVLPEPFIPVFTLVLGLAALSIAAVLVCLQIPLRGFSAAAFCAVFVAFPQMAYQFQFMNQADTIGIGYALAVGSFCLMDASERAAGHRRLRLALLAVLALTFAFGIYQTLALIPLTLFGGVFALRHAAQPGDLRLFVPALIRTGLASAVAVVLGVVVSRVFIAATGHVNDDYLFQNALSFNDLLDHLREYFKLLGRLLGGEGPAGLELYLAATIASVLFAIALGYRHRSGSVPAILGVVLTLVLPFMALLASSGMLPARTFVAMNGALALSIAYLGAIAGAALSAPAALAIFLVSFATVSRFFTADYLIRQGDIQIANRLVADIAEFDPAPAQTVYFFGAIEPARNVLTVQADTFGASFWAWDGGSTSRIVNFLAFYDLARFTVSSFDQIREVDPHARTMPIWPREGSIQWVGDVLVVRIGETRGYLPFPLDE